MDLEVQENNIHEKLLELFKLLFGGRYESHRTAVNFSSPFLRSMKTVDIDITLRFNKQIEKDITHSSCDLYVKQVLGDTFYVTGISSVELDDKFITVLCGATLSAYSNEAVMSSISNLLEEVRRSKFEESFNKEMENILDVEKS